MINNDLVNNDLVRCDAGNIDARIEQVWSLTLFGKLRDSKDAQAMSSGAWSFTAATTVS